MCVEILLSAGADVNEAGQDGHTALIVYRKGDIVKQPMKKGSFVPKNVPGVGWGRVGHEGVGWVM